MFYQLRTVQIMLRHNIFQYRKHLQSLTLSFWKQDRRRRTVFWCLSCFTWPVFTVLHKKEKISSWWSPPNQLIEVLQIHRQHPCDFREYLVLHPEFKVHSQINYIAFTWNKRYPCTSEIDALAFDWSYWFNCLYYCHYRILHKTTQSNNQVFSITKMNIC